jgi:hypothetical protein
MFDQRRLAGDIAAATGQRLAQGSHPDVDVGAGQPEVLPDAEPVRP